MEKDIELYDMGALVELYMQETKAFTAALEKGASWQELRERRLRVQSISIQINRKHKEPAWNDRRRDNRPPHHI